MGTSLFPQPISEQIWNLKYRFQNDNPDYPNDDSVLDTWFRIANACATSFEEEQQFHNALQDFKFLPAGRIIAGAGTGRNVTLFNCFVMGTIPDSLDGIFDMLKEAALTMQAGGGIGYDFSTLRPMGALVRGVDADASGPLTFMDVWDTMCKTIMSAGSRRGAMMATMRCDHPDIEAFIEAKKDPLRMRNFNLSVLVTDPFMQAVKDDEMWTLHWQGEEWKQIPARDLWYKILKNTYDQAEPGVIFIDRINKENNLWFAETIAATNPCGEQPLPPYGACLLGSINLTRFVRFPFTNKVELLLEQMERTVKAAVHMLDNVIDISKFPLEKQREEAINKRRMGLGVTGLADLLFMYGYRYGTEDAAKFTEDLMRRITIWAYEESVELAKKKGCAPIFESDLAKEQLCKSKIIQQLPKKLRKDIRKYGLRNSHLISIAPTGTISLYAGNVSSGIEPIFATSYVRKVTQKDGTKTEETVWDYAVDLFKEVMDPEWKDRYLVTAQELTPEDHIRMQAAAQKWVDSSISKTINCPEDITFNEFRQVYQDAFESGCKGCTTYRPNEITGSVLSIKEEPKQEEPVEETENPVNPVILDRPDRLDGTTYKLRWQGQAIYVTFTNSVDHGKIIPFEIFINSKNPEHQAWVTALTRMVSAVFRRGGDVSFVVEELKEVYDPKGGQFIDGKYVPSLVALLGQTLEKHMHYIGFAETDEETTPKVEEPVQVNVMPNQCPSCGGFNVVKEQGCEKCLDCGHSKCG